MSTFKIVTVGIFVFFGVIGVFVFASYGGSEKEPVPEVTIWGTLPSAFISEYVRAINEQKTIITAAYLQIDEDRFKETFINALAEGKGPDIVILPDDLLYEERGKLVPIGYQTYPERDFRDTFIDAAELFISKEGILGVPFAVDPMVMYWNKDVFSTAGVPRPPQFWSELKGLAPKLIDRNDTSSVVKAMVPLGEFRNVNNAKGIIATLLFQAGTNIVAQGDTGEFYSTIDTSTTGSSATTPINEAVNFYSAFSNPVSPLYTWNRSLPYSDEMFLSGDLAMYFGFASEIFDIRAKNPNLNFDVAVMPQAENATKATYGKMYALSIVKGTRSLPASLTAVGLMTSADAMARWTEYTSLPPVRRDLLSTRPKDPYLDVFYSAAIQSKAWMDPNAETSDEIFRDMIESVITGRTGGGSDVVTLAKQRLDQALKDNN